MNANDIACFVIPCFLEDVRQVSSFESALDSIEAQEDERWCAVVVDDASPSPRIRDAISRAVARHSDKMSLITLSENLGPGPARNKGIRYAKEKGASVVLFNDADDLSAPYRLEHSLSILDRNPEISVVYSSFNVIDENGKCVDRANLTPSIREILDAHDSGPPIGRDCWRRIATETGYISLTSTVAVRLPLAAEVPFPDERVSEDYHTWLRYSAYGGEFYYTEPILSYYRIPSFSPTSSVRARVGDSYYSEKARVDHLGFIEAVAMAAARDRVKAEEMPALEALFFKLLATTVAREGKFSLSNECLLRAAKVPSPEMEKVMDFLRGHSADG